MCISHPGDGLPELRASKPSPRPRRAGPTVWARRGWRGSARCWSASSTASKLELPHYWITYGAADPSVTGGRYRAATPGPPRIPARGQDWAPVLRADAASASDLSVTALLSQALVAFAIDYEAVAWCLSLTVHALAWLDPGGTPFLDVPPLAGLTGDGKSLLERHGIVKVDGPPRDKAKRVARLTPIGTQLRDAYGPGTSSAEARRHEVYGDTVVIELRSALEAVLPKLEPGLADHPVLTWTGGLRETSSG